MNNPSKPAADERKALNDSERRAERERPQNYKEEESAEKVVEVLPLDGDSAPIEGLDPKK